MKDQHTPRPWIIFPPESYENEDGEEDGYIHGWTVYSEATNDAICEFATLAGSGHEYENAESNARLIVNAPEMLELLREWLDDWNQRVGFQTPPTLRTQALLDSLDEPEDE